MKRLEKSRSDDIIALSLRMWGKNLSLVHFNDECTFCGLCVDICPFEAIEIDYDKAILTISEEKCSFCGLCDAICMFNAFEMNIDGKHTLLPVEFEAFKPLKPNCEVDKDKCLPCVLCEEVCPRDAVELKIKMERKEEIQPFKEDVEGEITIDSSKCTFCGLCALFCDAVELETKEIKPFDVSPFDSVKINREKCDYCKLCQEICPEEAISVVSDEKIARKPTFAGEIVIDTKKCIGCALCEKICPYDAIKIDKVFTGSISFNTKKCRRYWHPTSKCKACVDRCPAKILFLLKPKRIGRREEIAIIEDCCIYCGACFTNCPESPKVFSLSREELQSVKLETYLWKHKLSEKILREL